MPASAASKSPMRSATAPVKAPRACPKSSLSIKLSGVAPQLWATNAALRRSLSAWSARAISSLPVPVSPSTSTGSSLSAMRGSASRTSHHAGDSPNKSGI